MSSTTLTILSVLLAVVIVLVLAGALIVIRTALESASSKLATLADALEGVETEHLRPLEPAVKAINAQFDVIVGAFPAAARRRRRCPAPARRSSRLTPPSLGAPRLRSVTGAAGVRPPHQSRSLSGGLTASSRW